MKNPVSHDRGATRLNGAHASTKREGSHRPRAILTVERSLIHFMHRAPAANGRLGRSVSDTNDVSVVSDSIRQISGAGGNTWLHRNCIILQDETTDPSSGATVLTIFQNTWSDYA
jgi:hypothetical protein